MKFKITIIFFNMYITTLITTRKKLFRDQFLAIKWYC